MPPTQSMGVGKVPFGWGHQLRASRQAAKARKVADELASATRACCFDLDLRHEEVANTVATAAEVEDEIHHLIGVLRTP